MAREASITQEQVDAVANTIRAEGGKPSARLVLEALKRQYGVSPSMATVLKLFQEWGAGQAKPAAQEVALPVAIQRQLVDFVAQEVAAARADLQAEVVTLQQAKADLIGESDRQAATIETQVEAIEALTSEKAELVGRLAQIESDLARAVDNVAAERAAAEQARTDLAVATLRLEALPRLEAEADRLRGELAEERKARASAEQAAAVSAAKFEAGNVRIGDLQGRLAEIEAAHQKAETRAEQAEKQGQQIAQDLAACRQQATTQQGQLDEAHRTAKSAQAEAKKAGELAAELRGQLDEAHRAAKPEPGEAKTKK